MPLVLAASQAQKAVTFMRCAPVHSVALFFFNMLFHLQISIIHLTL